MSDMSWTAFLIRVLPWALAAFFLLGFAINTFATKLVKPEYRRWGYPDWFHLVSGGLELVVALLLLTATTRPFGVALGGAIMLAAIATVVRNREYHRAVPPLIVFALLATMGWSIWSAV